MIRGQGDLKKAYQDDRVAREYVDKYRSDHPGTPVRLGS